MPGDDVSTGAAGLTPILHRDRMGHKDDRKRGDRALAMDLVKRNIQALLADANARANCARSTRVRS